MQVINTLEQLDEKLSECDRAALRSDDALRQVFAEFRMAPPTGVPPDPFSPEYHRFQFELYRQIAGKDYQVANERTVFDVDEAVRRPFPYSTGSCTTTGEQWMLLGFVLRAMALKPGSRILELGAGWGNLSLALAMLGHQVTTLDVDEGFCELIRRRAARDNVTVEIVNDSYEAIDRWHEEFDVVLFLSSFHHAAEHVELLRTLRTTLKPEGRLIFGSEPIERDFPYPWGLRLDGQSLWSIRKHGWLELGFSERYFVEALKRAGWLARKHAAKDPPWLSVWEACRRETAALRFTVGRGELATQIGDVRDNAIVIDGASSGTALFGPYVTLPSGAYIARIHFRSPVQRKAHAKMDVVAEIGTTPLAESALASALREDDHLVAILPFDSDRELRDVEVRLFSAAGFSAEIEAVEIAAAD